MPLLVLPKDHRNGEMCIFSPTRLYVFGPADPPKLDGANVAFARGFDRWTGLELDRWFGGPRRIPFGNAHLAWQGKAQIHLATLGQEWAKQCEKARKKGQTRAE